MTIIFILLFTSLTIVNIVKFSSRDDYEFLALMSDTGGLAFLLSSLFQLVIQPLQAQNLLLKLMESLYTVRALDRDAKRMLIDKDNGKDPLTGKKTVRFDISGEQEEDSVIIDPAMRDL